MQVIRGQTITRPWWESSTTQQPAGTRGLKIAKTQTALCGSTGWLDGSLGPEAPLNFRCHHKLRL